MAKLSDEKQNRLYDLVGDEMKGVTERLKKNGFDLGIAKSTMKTTTQGTQQHVKITIVLETKKQKRPAFPKLD